jgi:Ternary complex associated domain 9/NACHT domain
MPGRQELQLETEFPDLDVVASILKRFRDDPGAFYSWRDEHSVRPLDGGLSGSVVLEMTLTNGSLLILKIGRTEEAEQEIAATREVQQRAGHMAIGSPALRIYTTKDRRWTGFTLYHVGSFLGSRNISPLTADVRGWHNCAGLADLVQAVFDILNQRIYAGWRISDSTSPFGWFEPRLFPLATADEGEVDAAGKADIRQKFWKHVELMDRGDAAAPFRFHLADVRVMSASADRTRLVCRHPDDEEAERIELRLREPVPAEALGRLLDSRQRTSIRGRVIAMRARRYEAVFRANGVDSPPLLPIEPSSFPSCRGAIHGDLHDANILVVRDENASSGRVISPAIIDFAKYTPDGPLWWDYVKLEISLRRLFLLDNPDAAGVLDALDALLGLAATSAAWNPLAEDFLARAWDEAFPEHPGLPRPFLRLRTMALELFRAQPAEFDLWLRDYHTCLYYGALVFLRYGHPPALEHYYCRLMERTSAALVAGRWYDYATLPPALATRVALAELERFNVEPVSADARRAAAAALGWFYSLGEPVYANLLAREEPPNPTLYSPPDAPGLSSDALDCIQTARATLRGVEAVLVRYRETTRKKLHHLEQSFAFLRGRYEIPLKARPEPEADATFDVLSLVRGLPACVVLGAPGSGKSTFAQFRRFTNCDLGEQLPVAVVIPFSRWSVEGSPAGGDPSPGNGPPRAPTSLEKSFLRLVAEEIDTPDPDMVATYCQAGAFLFIIDGLNEIAQEARGPFVAAVERLRRRYPGNQFMVTSRTLHYRHEFPSWPTIILEDLSQDEAVAYIRRMFRKREAEDGDRGASAEQLIERLFGGRASQGVRDLARTPMFLQLLLQHFAATGSLPESRGSLLKHVSDAVLGQSGGLPVKVLETALRRVAYTMLNADGADANRRTSLVSITREQAIAAFAPALPPGIDVGTVWSELLETAMLRADPGGGVAGFQHQAFLEFYASLHLVEVLRQDPARFLDHVEQRVWQEAVQTLVGYQTPATRPAIQEFLRWTPSINYSLATGCLLNAEHVDDDVRDGILQQLTRTLDDADETPSRRTAAAEALAALGSRLRGAKQALSTLLRHFESPNVCPDVVLILLRNEGALSSRQRQEYFTAVERFLAVGPEALQDIAVQALSQSDSSLSGAVTANLLHPSSRVGAEVRRALLRVGVSSRRLPLSTLRQLARSDDLRLRLETLTALAEIGQEVDPAEGTALLEALEDESRREMLIEMVEALGAAPKELFARDAERWIALVHRRLLASPEQLASVHSTLLKKAASAAGHSISLPRLDRTTLARLPLREAVELLTLPGIAVEDRVRTAETLVRGLEFRVERLDEDALRALVEALVRAEETMALLLAELVSRASYVPLWGVLAEALQAARAAGSLRSPLLAAIAEHRPLDARETATALEQLRTGRSEESARAWLTLCRPLPDGMLDEALPATSPVHTITLLGFHSLDRSLPRSVLARLQGELTQVPRGGIPLPGVPVAATRAILLRHGFALLEQNGYFKYDPAAREAYLRPTLHFLSVERGWVTTFILEQICRSEMEPLEHLAIQGDDDDALHLCAFVATISIHSGHERLAGPLGRRIKRWLAAPGRLDAAHWPVVLEAITRLRIRGVEPDLVRVVRRYGRWRRHLEGGLSELLRRGNPQTRLFHLILRTLHEIGSDRVPDLVFSHFSRWDLGGKRESLELLGTIGWPAAFQGKLKWSRFFMQHLDHLMAPELVDLSGALFGALKDAPRVVHEFGPTLRAFARDRSHPLAAREAADAAADLLGKNNDTFVPYEPSLREWLRARMNWKAST